MKLCQNHWSLPDCLSESGSTKLLSTVIHSQCNGYSPVLKSTKREKQHRNFYPKNREVRKDSAHITQDLKMIFVQKKPSSFTRMANYHGHRNNKLAKDFIYKKTGSMLTFSLHSTRRATNLKYRYYKKLNCMSTYQFVGIGHL